MAGSISLPSKESLAAAPTRISQSLLEKAAANEMDEISRFPRQEGAWNRSSALPETRRVCRVGTLGHATTLRVRRRPPVGPTVGHGGR